MRQLERRLQALEHEAGRRDDRLLIVLTIGKSEEQVQREVEALQLRPGEVVIVVDK
jgi:hypothetical protein